MAHRYLFRLALVAVLGLTTPQLVRSDERGDDSTIEATKVAPVRERAQLLGVERWQRQGVRGQGVKVAILDSGFRGYRDHLGKALPAKVTTRSFRNDGDLEARDSQHGILCAEIVHKLAPDVEILFANWEPDRPGCFLQAVQWARQQGAKVVSCSVIMPSWSDGEGGGAIHEELSRLLGPGSQRGDVLFFASAGNTAQRHWAGRFTEDSSNYHVWQSGSTENALTPWNSEPVNVELYGQLGSAYEVSVWDRTAGRETGRAVAEGKEQRCSGHVRFTPEAGHAYQARVRLLGGPAGKFHLVALNSGLEFSTAASSIPFPADSPHVLAVGAVDNRGQRQNYSSCGPNSPRPKPDLVAPVPFPSSWRSKPFSGTSAAAPQAAALAALLWSKNPTWPADQVRNALKTSTRDLNRPGHDWETGYGLVQLP